MGGEVDADSESGVDAYGREDDDEERDVDGEGESEEDGVAAAALFDAGVFLLPCNSCSLAA